MKKPCDDPYDVSSETLILDDVRNGISTGLARSLRGGTRRMGVPWDLIAISEEPLPILPPSRAQAVADWSREPCGGLGESRFPGLCPFDLLVHPS